MFFSRNRATSTKQGTNLAATDPSKVNSGDNFAPGFNLNAVSDFRLPTSHPSSSGRPYSPDNPGAPGPRVTPNVYHGPISEDDIVIAIMGPTGVGKSSFVNTVAGTTMTVVGESLKSQTRHVHPVRCRHPDGRDIILVDTPGFDDTYLSDSQILRIVATWLKDTYKSNIKLAGLLYLHRISDVRMAGTPLRNLAVFRDLCGSDNLKNVVLVTTMWDELEDELLGYEREEQLLSGFWEDMIAFGSRTRRFQRTPESAWEIINLLDLKTFNPKLAALQIQREMVDRELPLQETAAARTLLRSVAGEFKKFLAKLRRVRRSVSSGEPSHPQWSAPMSSTPSTPRSIASGSSWSAVSPLADTQSITSGDSGYSSRLTWSAFAGCSANGRRNSLSEMTAGLRISYEMADIASIFTLQESISTVLHIAQLLEGMNGFHHVISQVLECSGWLLEEIAQYVAEPKLTTDMNITLSSLQSGLNNLQDVVKNMSTREPVPPFLLHDADIQVMTTCVALIKQIYDMLEIEPVMGNRHAISRLQEQTTALWNNQASRKCECGISVVHEE